MAWSAGVFSRLYNFVADAAAGTKILASKMDAELGGIATGITNCLTKDGQNSPTANINWGGKKITNLAAGTAASDAARFDQILSSEWVAEANGITWVSSTSFKVLAADKRTTYSLGRRIKSTNTGVVVYSTVITVSYSAPDTTVTVVSDGSSALDASMSGLYYGFLSYVNQSYIPPRTAAQAYTDTGQVLAANTITQLEFNNTIFDRLAEFNTTTFRWVAKNTTGGLGAYRFDGSVRFEVGANAGYCDIFLILDGDTAQPYGWTSVWCEANKNYVLPFNGISTSGPTQYAEVWVRAQMAGVTAGALVGVVPATFFNITKVP